MRNVFWIKSVFRWTLAIAMIAIGAQHFLAPHFFVLIVPSYLPAHRLLVQMSGAAEIAGGCGLLVLPVRRAAAWGLIALYIAVFPANVNMALHPGAFNGLSPVLLWARLPLQLVLIAWAYWFTQIDKLPAEKEIHVAHSVAQIQ